MERSLEVAPRPDDVPAEWIAQEGRTPVVHVAAMPFASAVRMVEHVRASGPAVVTLDTHEDWAATRTEVVALARRVDVFVPSREELAVIVGYDDPERACRDLLDEGLGAVVVKCGAEGALVGGVGGSDVAHSPCRASLQRRSRWSMSPAPVTASAVGWRRASPSARTCWSQLSGAQPRRAQRSGPAARWVSSAGPP